MKKWIYIIGFLIIIVIAIFIGNYLYHSNSSEKEKSTPMENTPKNVVQETKNKIQDEVTIETTTKEEKISPKATLILKKHYQECDHTIKEYAQIPEEFVNLTKEELQKQYPNWIIESFSSSEISLIKEEQGVCNEHYLLKQNDGVIAVYQIGKNGEETLIETTGISTEYLTENDRMKIEQGIQVFGKEELNSTLEDYE